MRYPRHRRPRPPHRLLTPCCVRCAVLRMLCREVDHVLTTRDLGEILRDRGIDFASLPDTPYDTFMDVGSGAAAIFGTTGGVMEAALR